MATISKTWATQAQCIGTGDATITLSGTTEAYSSDIDLETNGYEGAQVEIEVQFDASPTDDVDVKVYPSLDATYDGEEIAVSAVRVAKKDNDSKFISLIVRDVAHFRVGVVQTGATDSHDVRAYYQSWRWQSA